MHSASLTPLPRSWRSTTPRCPPPSWWVGAGQPIRLRPNSPGRARLTPKVLTPKLCGFRALQVGFNAYSDLAPREMSWLAGVFSQDTSAGVSRARPAPLQGGHTVNASAGQRPLSLPLPLPRLRRRRSPSLSKTTPLVRGAGAACASCCRPPRPGLPPPTTGTGRQTTPPPGTGGRARSPATPAPPAATPGLSPAPLLQANMQTPPSTSSRE